MVLTLGRLPWAASADRGCAPLIAAGATIDWVDGEGVTPLILAAFKGHRALVQRLLAEGTQTELCDQWGRSALDYALRRDETDPIARMLRAAEK